MLLVKTSFIHNLRSNFSQTSTFCKTQVNNNMKKHFLKKPNKNTFQENKIRLCPFHLFPNIADKTKFSLKNQVVTFIPLPFP